MNDSFRQRLAYRLLEYPFLRMMVLDVRLPLILGLLGLVLLLVPVSLLKVWRTTPEGFLPVVRVSLLDMGQAWSLRRSALEEAGKGKWETALVCWEAAAANNPGDPNLVRGYLELMATLSPDPGLLERAAGRGFWLLHLTQTNASDLALVGRTLGKLGLPEDLVGLLAQGAGKLPADLEFLYAQALFELGRVDEFTRHWSLVRARLVATIPPEEGAFHDTLLRATTGTEAERRESLAQLRAMATRSPRPTEGGRALLMVAAHQRNGPVVEEALGYLIAQRADALKDHLVAWRALMALGRAEEVRPLVTAWSLPPQHAREALQLVQVRLELGLREAAVAACEDGVTRLGGSADLWYTYGVLLLELRRWEELRRVAVRMRVAEETGNSLTGLSYFLEGRAELGLGHLDQAQMSFQAAAAATFPNPRWGQAVAAGLLQLRQAKECLEILDKIRESFQDNAGYWMMVFEAADLRKDAVRMRDAAARAYALRPEDPVVMNNYAASLLILREQPELAARLTLAMLSRHPGTLEPVVNHAAALLLNRRVDEADRLLRRVEASRLSPQQSTLFYLDRFEVELEQGAFAEARLSASRVRVEDLYPPQRIWFTNALGRLPAGPD